jgi:hypothetical protein
MDEPSSTEDLSAAYPDIQLSPPETPPWTGQSTPQGVRPPPVPPKLTTEYLGLPTPEPEDRVRRDPIQLGYVKRPVTPPTEPRKKKRGTLQKLKRLSGFGRK